MSGYMGLSDVGGECPTYATTAAVKFCSMNFVTSSKWTGKFDLCAVTVATQFRCWVYLFVCFYFNSIKMLSTS